MLAIDPSSTALGWCANQSDGSLAYGVLRTRPTFVRARRLADLGDQIRDLMDEHHPNYVVMYRPMVRGEGATRALWGIAAVIEMCAYEYGTGVGEYTDSQVRAYFKLGNGLSKLPKPERRAESKARAIRVASLITRTSKVLTDDEAEAILLNAYIRRGEIVCD